MGDPPRQAGGRAGRLFSLVGLAMLAFFVALAVVFVLRTDSPPEAARQPAAGEGPQLAEQPEPLPVARGLKGLRFGMTPEEAQAALPGLRDPEDLRWVMGEGEDLRLDSFHARSELQRLLPAEPPGPRLAGPTRLGTEPAACLLAFAVEERLSAMACLLGPYRSEETHRAAERALVTALTAKYGHPQKTPESGHGAYGVETERRWLWQDGGARLELVSSYDRMNELMPALMQTSKLSLKNEAAEHLQAAEQLKREAEQRARQEEEARRRASEEELRRLQRPSVDFGKDL